MNNTTNQNFLLKIVFKDDIRRVSVPSLTYSSTQKVVAETFRLEESFKIKCKDNEGDLCTIDSDFGLAEALSMAEEKGMLLKIHVTSSKINKSQSIHHRIICDGCGKCPIRGDRFKCTVCPDFDLCSSCEVKDEHPFSHAMIKMYVPQQRAALHRCSRQRRRERFVGCPASRQPRVNIFFKEFLPEQPTSPCQERCTRSSLDEKVLSELRKVRSACVQKQFCAKQKQALFDELRRKVTQKQPYASVRKRFCAVEKQALFDELRCKVAQRQPNQNVQLEAKYMSDVTLEDGSIVRPGQFHIKTWKVKNTGVSWPLGTKLIFVRGDDELLSQEEFDVPLAGKGQIVDLSALLTIPSQPRLYRTYFQLADANRRVFGQRLWVDLRVADETDVKESQLEPTTEVKTAVITSNVTSNVTTPSVEVETRKCENSEESEGNSEVEVSEVKESKVQPTVECNEKETVLSKSQSSVKIEAQLSTSVTKTGVCPPDESEGEDSSSWEKIDSKKDIVQHEGGEVKIKADTESSTSGGEYNVHLSILDAMGYANEPLNRSILKLFEGNIQKALDWLKENASGTK